MYKAILICALLLSVYAGNVRKPHKAVHDKKTRTFNSAFIEFENFGEQDYHLSPKVAQHWAEITSQVEHESKKHTAFVESHPEYVPGMVGESFDLSKNAGVYSYTVTDINGNIIDQAAGDHLADKLNSDYLATTSQLQREAPKSN